MSLRRRAVTAMLVLLASVVPVFATALLWVVHGQLERAAATGQVGDATALFVALALLIVASVLTFTMLMVGWLDRNLLDRIGLLSRLVALGDDPHRPTVELPGDDELSELARHAEHVFSVLEDTQEELAATAADLQRAVDSKDRYLSVLSHDLRAPLSVVLGWAETLEARGEELDDEQRAMIAASIVRGGRRVDSLLADLLTLGRARESRLAVMPDRVRARELASRMLEETDIDGPLRTQGDDDAVVLADPSHVERMVSNLLSNAGKYGQPPITVAVMGSPTDPDAFRIEVRDHGPGIPGDYEDLLFDPFTQADPGDADRGTGLGLSIVAELAALNDGTAGYTRRGDETVFWIELPAAAQSAPREVSAA